MKLLPSLFSSFLLSQTLYQGSLEFSYDGSETGSFSSSLEDTTNFAGALNVTLNDSSSFMMLGINPKDENTFDLFLTVLQDSTFPMQPRTWSWDISIADIANIIENPLNLSTLSIFIPDLDSSFANQWLTFFTDTSLVSDSLSIDSLSSFFVENLLDDSYIATQGDIEIDSIENQAVIGNFTLTLWKPLFSFTNISSGNFNFSPIDLENLEIQSANQYIPQTIALQKAYPNPFNPTTKIPFFIKESQLVKISIFDITGKLVRNVSNRYFEPGNHHVKLPSNDLTSGIYFIMLNHKNGVDTQKITFLK